METDGRDSHLFQVRDQAQRWLTPQAVETRSSPTLTLPCLGIYCFHFYLSGRLYLLELLPQVLTVPGISEDFGGWGAGMLCSKKCKLP